VVARLPLPIGGGGALCALNRCRAERGNEDEEPSLARAQRTPRDEGRQRDVAGPDALQGRSRGAPGAAERRHSAAPSARRRDHRPRARTDRELVVSGGGRTTTRRYDDEQFVAEFHRMRGTLSKSMSVIRTACRTADVAAATCDGAAVERGRGREAGVLMVARQGEAHVVRWTRRPTCGPFWRRGRRRTASAPAPLMVSPENTNAHG